MKTLGRQHGEVKRQIKGEAGGNILHGEIKGDCKVKCFKSLAPGNILMDPA